MKLLLTPLNLIFMFGLTLQASTLTFYTSPNAHVDVTYGSITLSSDPGAIAEAWAAFDDSIQLLGPPETVNWTVTLVRYATVSVQGDLGIGAGDHSITFHCGGNDCMPETLTVTMELDGAIDLGGDAFLNTGNFPPAGGALIQLSFGPIVLTDSSGNPITGVPYISDSGTAYLRDEVLVPEPGTSLLLIGGLLTMLVFARRSRKA
jgi:hypothetical protein